MEFKRFMERKIKEIFEKFLIDSNCYSEFVTNLLEQKQLSLDEYLLQNNSPKLLILNAFP